MHSNTAFHPLLLFLDTKCHQDGYQTVASCLHVSISTLHRYRQGNRRPNATTLARILRTWPADATPLVIDYLRQIP